MKIISFILLFFFLSTKDYAQQSPISIKGFPNVEEYFYKKYTETIFNQVYSSLLDTICEAGCSFLSFNINREGKISDINVNKSTPAFFKTILIDMFNQSNGKWVMEKSIKEDSICILIPIFYNFFLYSNNGCKPHKKNHLNAIETMMSAFGGSERGRGVERLSAPKNAWIFSPFTVSSPLH